VSAPLSAAFECITDAFFALDRRWRFTYINHEAERFLMRSRADLLGVELWTAFPELIGTRFERSYRQAMAEQTPVEFESPVRPLDRWFEVRAYPSLDGLSIYFLDITQRKQAEQALRHQNAYLAALHETTLALMNRLDLSDVLETIVVRAAALIGTEHGYIYLVDDDAETITIRVGTGIFNDFVGEQLRRGQALAGRVWQTGQPLSVPDYSRWPERAPDYERSDLRACAAVPLTSDGAVVGVLGLGYAASSRVFGDDQFMVLVRFAQLASIALDNARLYTAAQRELADRKRAEAALRANEQRYRALFEHTNDAVFMISLDGVIAAGNQQACDLLGYSHAELVGMSLAQITLPEDRHAGQERLIALITGQPLATYERTMLTKSGAGARWRRPAAAFAEHRARHHRAQAQPGRAARVRGALSAAVQQQSAPDVGAGSGDAGVPGGQRGRDPPLRLRARRVSGDDDPRSARARGPVAAGGASGRVRAGRRPAQPLAAPQKRRGRDRCRDQLAGD
jgi:PAS domain S-box-containing protein